MNKHQASTNSINNLLQSILTAAKQLTNELAPSSLTQDQLEAVEDELGKADDAIWNAIGASEADTE
jgi:hypothetical protein